MNMKKGMTLIECVVWIAVLISAMLALSSAVLYFYRTNQYVVQSAVAIASAQHAMDIAVRAIRTASYSNTGAYPIISIAPNQISFYANVTPNDTNFQQVRFFTQGTSLEEGIIEPSGDPPSYSNPETITNLSNYVQNIPDATSTFVYYDQSGNQINDYSKFGNVRFVVINIVVDVATSTLPVQLILNSSAALRNLVTH